MDVGLYADLTEQIVGCAIEVHRHLGPGLLESIYETALCIELNAARISFKRQIGIPLFYKRPAHFRASPGSCRVRPCNRGSQEHPATGAGTHGADDDLPARGWATGGPHTELQPFRDEARNPSSDVVTTRSVEAKEKMKSLCLCVSVVRVSYQRKTRLPRHNGPSRTYCHSGFLAVSLSAE